MSREEFNRYENDQKHKKGKREKRIRSPVSKGSVRSQGKQDLKRAIYSYDLDDTFGDK